HEADSATLGGFWRSMADGQARRATREAAIGQQRTGFAEALRFQVARGIEHFLHAGAAAWAFVADDDNVAFLDLVGKDRLDGRVLAFKDAGRAGELEDRLVD